VRLARILVVQVLVAVGPLAGQSRIHTDVDTTLVTVGDRITMTVSVEHASSARVVWPDSLRLAPFEVLEARLLPTETAGEVARSTWVLTLAAFELGELEIPSFDVVVVGPEGPIAKGLVNYRAEDVRRILGKKTSEIAATLGQKEFDEIIHRDNLVLLQ